MIDRTYSAGTRMARSCAVGCAGMLLWAAPAWPEPTECSAARARFVVGQIYTRELAQDARMAAGAETVRKLEPKQAHTTEFRQRRLNLYVDPFGSVTGVRCG